jgi:type IV secretory pathway VirB4 component
MKLVKQQVTLPIKNFDTGIEAKRSKNGPLLPNSIRALICGPSGAGKTNLMFCLLTDQMDLNLKMFMFTVNHYINLSTFSSKK